MTYFDPHIYCKQNLKEKDKKEMEYWKSECEIVLDMAYDRYQEDYCCGDSLLLDEIKTQIVTEFVEIAKECLGIRLQDNVVSCIDSYEEEIEEVENPETFDYMKERIEELPFSTPEE